MHNFQDAVFIYEDLCSQISTLYQCTFNPFQSSVAFHIETTHMICRVKLMIGFYMKGHNGLKWVKCVPKINVKNAYLLKPESYLGRL